VITFPFSFWKNATAGVTYILNDTFTEASLTALTSHTMDVGSGAWSTTSNMSVGAGTGTTFIATPVSSGGGVRATNSFTPPSANYTVGIIGRTVVANVDNLLGVYGRYLDGGNNYYLYIYGDGTMKLFVKDGGAVTQLGSTYTISGFSASTDYDISIVLSGSSISAKLTGSVVIGPVTNTVFAGAGIVGLFMQPVTTTSPTATQFYVI